MNITRGIRCVMRTAELDDFDRCIWRKRKRQVPGTAGEERHAEQQ